MAIRSSPQLNSLRQRALYQGKKEEELSLQQRAEQLRQQDPANSRRDQPGQAQPTQGQLAGAQKPGMFDVEMDKPVFLSDAEMAAAESATVVREAPTTPQGLRGRITLPAASQSAPSPAAPAGGDQEKKGSIFDVSPEEEKAAFGQELEAQRAKAMQQAEARAGAAGMGLSGATSQLVSDVGRQQMRAGQLAMGDFERAQAAGQLQDLQRQASIWQFEEEFGVDLNGDNVYGAPAGAKVSARPLSEDINQDGIVDEKDKELASTFEQQGISSRWSEATDTNPTYLSSVSDVPSGYRRRNRVTSPDGKKYGFYVPEDGSGKTYLVEEG